MLDSKQVVGSNQYDRQLGRIEIMPASYPFGVKVSSSKAGGFSL